MSTSPTPPPGPAPRLAYDPLSPESFVEKLLGLLLFLVERVLLNWKATALGIASFACYLAHHYALNSKPPLADPSFWGAAGTFVLLALKQDK